MNKRHYEHTLPNIRGSLSNTYSQSPAAVCHHHEDSGLIHHPCPAVLKTDGSPVRTKIKYFPVLREHGDFVPAPQAPQTTCNLQIFLCLFLEKLNMPQDTPVTKAS